MGSSTAWEEALPEETSLGEIRSLKHQHTCKEVGLLTRSVTLLDLGSQWLSIGLFYVEEPLQFTVSAYCYVKMISQDHKLVRGGTG